MQAFRNMVSSLTRAADGKHPSDEVLQKYREDLNGLRDEVVQIRQQFTSYSDSFVHAAESAVVLSKSIVQFYQQGEPSAIKAAQFIIEEGERGKQKKTYTKFFSLIYNHSNEEIADTAVKLFQQQQHSPEGLISELDNWLQVIRLLHQEIEDAERARAAAQTTSDRLYSLKEQHERLKKKQSSAGSTAVGAQELRDLEERIKDTTNVKISLTKDFQDQKQKIGDAVTNMLKEKYHIFDRVYVQLLECQFACAGAYNDLMKPFKGLIDLYRKQYSHINENGDAHPLYQSTNQLLQRTKIDANPLDQARSPRHINQDTTEANTNHDDQISVNVNNDAHANSSVNDNKPVENGDHHQSDEKELNGVLHTRSDSDDNTAATKSNKSATLSNDDPSHSVDLCCCLYEKQETQGMSFFIVGFWEKNPKGEISSRFFIGILWISDDRYIINVNSTRETRFVSSINNKKTKAELEKTNVDKFQNNICLVQKVVETAKHEYGDFITGSQIVTEANNSSAGNVQSSIGYLFSTDSVSEKSNTVENTQKKDTTAKNENDKPSSDMLPHMERHDSTDFWGMFGNTTNQESQTSKVATKPTPTITSTSTLASTTAKHDHVNVLFGSSEPSRFSKSESQISRPTNANSSPRRRNQQSGQHLEPVNEQAKSKPEKGGWCTSIKMLNICGLFLTIVRDESKIEERVKERIRFVKESYEIEAKDHAERTKYKDELETRLDEWEYNSGVRRNIRSLLTKLPEVLWEDSGWKPVSLGDLVQPAKCKKAYQMALRVVHPDRAANRGDDAKNAVICERVFTALNEAWNEFEKTM
ncbi:hypothetical protein RFI_28613 [Reticulomyxa filosa]|uniref:J domain-containing protein n=1 Tax=Reticulomyxa filosa TaxID=46433 RepID=X6M5N5_RETFI|nr:hypothetical protein RFI_28613 [Reticulomyxa filosa]|eukprot:ETO08782.1 hypothetical protein RFI_28613 [Reticulomyxa filosa]